MQPRLNSAPAARADLVTATSHIAPHTTVSSAFTCSSAQQGLCAAAAAVAAAAVRWERRFPTYPQGRWDGWGGGRGRGVPVETTEPRVLLLLLLLLLAPVDGQSAADGEEFQVSQGLFLLLLFLLFR